MEPAFFALFALLGKDWGAALVREEAGVALASLATCRCEEAVAVVGEVGEFAAVEVIDDGAFGDHHFEVGRRSAVLLLAAPVLSRARLTVRMVSKVQE